MNRIASTRVTVKKIHSLGLKGYLTCGLLILSLIMIHDGTSNAAIDMEPYYAPNFVLGNAKTYVEDGWYTILTVLPGTVEVNGIQTIVSEETGGKYPGRRFYRSKDATGCYAHRTFVPNVYLEGVGFADVTSTFSPPVLAPPPILSIGQTISGKSGLVMEFVTKTQGTTSLVYTYEYSYTVVGFENVTVPLGNFDALKITNTVKIYGTNDGMYESVTNTETNWLVANIGGVRNVTVYDKGETSTEELVRINFGHPPVAYAGSDRTVAEGTTVTLDASGSTDIDGDIALYQWTQVSGPEVTLVNPSSVRATFIAPDMGDTDEILTFELTVMDNLGFKHSDTITISLRKKTSLPFLMLLLED